MFTQLFSQARQLVWFLSALYLLPLLALFVLVAANLELGIPMAFFTRDPADLMKRHPLIGAISNLGVIWWAATAAICLFTWAISRHSPGRMRFSTFLFYSGLFTTFLLLDDLFLLHEVIFPYYFGVPEMVYIVFYAVLTLSWVMIFKKHILKSEYLILLIALGFFGLSIVIDMFEFQIQETMGRWCNFFEEGSKLLGIFSWFGYFLRSCLITAREQNGRIS